MKARADLTNRGSLRRPHYSFNRRSMTDSGDQVIDALLACVPRSLDPCLDLDRPLEIETSLPGIHPRDLPRGMKRPPHQPDGRADRRQA